MGRSSIAFLFVLLVITPAAYAVTYTVGGRSGWDTNVNYDTWVSDLTFTTADSLVFNYDSSHTVDEVTAAEYASCSSDSPISVASNSPTTIPLTAAGTRYFVCLRSNHCAQGMKLTVTVTAGTTPVSPSPPSGTTPSPPSGGATPSPPPRTPTTPTPAAPSAATTLGGRNSFIVGSLLVFVAGLMG